MFVDAPELFADGRTLLPDSRTLLPDPRHSFPTREHSFTTREHSFATRQHSFGPLLACVAHVLGQGRLPTRKTGTADGNSLMFCTHAGGITPSALTSDLRCRICRIFDFF